jgi:hypothetical protein
MTAFDFKFVDYVRWELNKNKETCFITTEKVAKFQINPPIF